MEKNSQGVSWSGIPISIWRLVSAAGVRLKIRQTTNSVGAGIVNTETAEPRQE
jgi:hypothetical protein